MSGSFAHTGSERDRLLAQILKDEAARLRKLADEFDPPATSAPAQGSTTALAEFFRWAMENGPFNGCDLDGGGVQDKAASLGLIEPAKDRDDWWVYTDAARGHSPAESVNVIEFTNALYDSLSTETEQDCGRIARAILSKFKVTSK